jgi:hypothetical protein
VSVVRFGLESMTEDMIGRDVEEEWDCSETVMGMSGQMSVEVSLRRLG